MPDPKKSAELEQGITQMAEVFSRASREFFAQSVKAGFNPAEAMSLTHVYLREVVSGFMLKLKKE